MKTIITLGTADDRVVQGECDPDEWVGLLIGLAQTCEPVTFRAETHLGDYLECDNVERVVRSLSDDALVSEEYTMRKGRWVYTETTDDATLRVALTAERKRRAL